MTTPALTEDQEATIPSHGGRTDAVRRRRSRFAQPALLVGFFIAVVAVWEAVVQLFDIPLYLVPAPSDVGATFADNPSFYLMATVFTGLEAITGLGAAVVLGGGIAVALARSRILDRLIMPYLVLLQVTPMVAIAPLLTIWFGFGFAPKAIVAFLTSFFPITVTTAVGLRSTDRDALDLFHVLAASERYIFWRLRIPFALPHFLSSLKIAAPASVIGAIIAEFVSSGEGLGYVIMTASSSLQTASLFVAILGSAVVGIAAFALALVAERRFLRWHESQMD